LALNGFVGTVSVQSGFGSAGGAVLDGGDDDGGEDGDDEGGDDEGGASLEDGAPLAEVGVADDEAAADKVVVAPVAGELVTIATPAAIAATAITGARMVGRVMSLRKKFLRGFLCKPRWLCWRT
jgi:hypothetical protein